MRTQQGLALVSLRATRVPAPFDLTCGGGAVGHAAETDAGNLEAGLAEIEVVHDSFRGERACAIPDDCLLNPQVWRKAWTQVVGVIG